MISKTLSFKILTDLEIHDGNGDAVVQDHPGFMMHDEASSVDSVPRMINEDPGPSSFGGFTNWLLISQHDVE